MGRKAEKQWCCTGGVISTFSFLHQLPCLLFSATVQSLSVFLCTFCSGFLFLLCVFRKVMLADQWKLSMCCSRIMPVVDTHMLVERIPLSDLV